MISLYALLGLGHAERMRMADINQCKDVAANLSRGYSEARRVADLEYDRAVEARRKVREEWVASGCDDARLEVLQQAYANYNNAHNALDRAIDDDLSAFERVMNLKSM